MRREQRQMAIKESGIVTAAVESFQDLSMQEKRRQIRERLLRGERVTIDPSGRLRTGGTGTQVPPGKLGGIAQQLDDLDRETEVGFEDYAKSQWWQRLYDTFGVTDLLLVVTVVVAAAALVISH